MHGSACCLFVCVVQNVFGLFSVLRSVHMSATIILSARGHCLRWSRLISFTLRESMRMVENQLTFPLIPSRLHPSQPATEGARLIGHRLCWEPRQATRFLQKDAIFQRFWRQQLNIRALADQSGMEASCSMRKPGSRRALPIPPLAYDPPLLDYLLSLLSFNMNSMKLIPLHS